MSIVDFKNKLNVTEHALSLFASKYVLIEPQQIFDDEYLLRNKKLLSECHVYIIGILPKVTIVDLSVDNSFLYCKVNIKGRENILKWPAEDNWVVLKDENKLVRVYDGSGKVVNHPTLEEIRNKLIDETNAFDYGVLYVGQAYGKNGARNIIDRLRNHEKLLQIISQYQDTEYRVQIIGLSIKNAGKLITCFNPWAKNPEFDSERIKSGLDFISNLTERQEVSLYEASLINYFKPKYNVIYTKKLTGTNKTLLRQCYDKDISCILAELDLDLYYRWYSSEIKPETSCCIRINLFDEKERQMFFASLGD